MSFTHQGREIRKVAVIGSGQIGPDIALYFTKVLSPFGVQTVVVDVSEDALAGGRKKLEKKVAKGVETGAFSEEQQAKMVSSVSWTTDYEDIRGAKLVVEAATENKELKGKIFSMVEGLVADDAILCSNSSHLEPEVIFANSAHKGRTGVVHYFFPAERNLLVEVVPGKDTADATTKWLMSFYEQIGKVPIEVQSRYGYALDPVVEGLFYACALLAERGVASTKEIDVVCKRTFKMGVGSFTAMNLTGGNPITAVGLDNYTTKIGPYFRTPDSLKDKVACFTYAPSKVLATTGLEEQVRLLSFLLARTQKQLTQQTLFGSFSSHILKNRPGSAGWRGWLARGVIGARDGGSGGGCRVAVGEWSA